MDTERTNAIPSDPVEQLLSQREVEQVTKTSKATIDRAVRAGELPVVRLGRSRRFQPSDVRAFIARHRSGPPVA